MREVTGYIKEENCESAKLKYPGTVHVYKDDLHRWLSSMCIDQNTCSLGPKRRAHNRSTSFSCP